MFLIWSISLNKFKSYTVITSVSAKLLIGFENVGRCEYDTDILCQHGKFGDDRSS